MDLFEKGTPPAPEAFETPRQRHERVTAAKRKADAEAMQAELEKWKPKENAKAAGDAYKTLFVSKISYDTTEKKLRREFEQFGRIKSIRMVNDLEGKPRGYAFVEYENEDDMRMAYKRGDGRKIDGRRVTVDVERGRTVRNWKPRRFGGGLGDTRKERPKKGHEAEWRARERDVERQKEEEKAAQREKERADREKERGEKSVGSRRGDSRERGRDR
ncbi:unnamed protein product [Choristocarpus tenellus]